MILGTPFSLFSPCSVGFCRPSATLATSTLTVFMPVRSTAPRDETLVVGFQTSGLFSSLSRFEGPGAGASADFAGGLLLYGSEELEELEEVAGLLPPVSAHATRNASSRNRYGFILRLPKLNVEAASDVRSGSSIIRPREHSAAWSATLEFRTDFAASGSSRIVKSTR